MDYNHPSVVEYIAASKEMASYFKVDTCEPPAVNKRYKLAVQDIRDYLDSIDIKMPAPLFPYEQKDKTTWKFSDVVLCGYKTGKKYLCAIPNPEWKYRDTITQGR